MEIGWVDGNGSAEACCGQCQFDINMARRQLQCDYCGEFGHVANECPYNPNRGKGKGKGIKDEGKGVWPGKAGKAQGKGLGWAAKAGAGGGKKGGGERKGYQGACWKCHRVGHKAWECNVVDEYAGHEEGEEGCEELDCDGVWMVANAEDIGDNEHNKVSHIEAEEQMKDQDIDDKVSQTWKNVFEEARQGRSLVQPRKAAELNCKTPLQNWARTVKRKGGDQFCRREEGRGRHYGRLRSWAKCLAKI